MRKYIHCKLCDEIFANVDEYAHHLEIKHSESIPEDMGAYQFIDFLRTGRTHGNCVICKSQTNWNTKTNKYFRFCKNPKCKEKYTEEFRKRMVGKYGKTTLLNDPDHQRKMLSHRKISGVYRWSDNPNIEISYTGSYELDFLKFLDIAMDFDGEDVIGPSPHTYYYIYEGKKHFYFPDFFIPSLNLEVEIKDGGDNPNTHHKIVEVDKVKEKLKDEVITKNGTFSYIKIVNKEYRKFFTFLEKSKQQFVDGINKPIFML